MEIEAIFTHFGFWLHRYVLHHESRATSICRANTEHEMTVGNVRKIPVRVQLAKT